MLNNMSFGINVVCVPKSMLNVFAIVVSSSLCDVYPLSKFRRLSFVSNNHFANFPIDL